MIDFLKKHLVEKNTTYFDHGLVAMSIGVRLLISSVLFFIHSIFPFISIPRPFNLECMVIYLFDKNIEIED